MTRQQARERVRQAFEASLDEMIPLDQTKPLKGRRFGDWEDQLEGMIRKISPIVLEGRQALEENARMEQAGRCPHCSSERTYLESQEVLQKRHGPHGVSNVLAQQARCRGCNGSFSPSAS
jgi:hypothetical protein